MTTDHSSLFADLEKKLATAPLSDCPALMGELERLKGLLLVKVVMVDKSAKEPANKNLLTVRQVAENLAIPEGRVYELARLGRLPCLRIGKYVRVDPAVLTAWIHQQKDLDVKLYQRYSLQANDWQRTQNTARADGDDSSGTREKSRGRSQHHRSMGAGRAEDQRARGAICSPASLVDP